MLKLTLKKQKILMHHQQVLVCNIEYLWVVQVLMGEMGESVRLFGCHLSAELSSPTLGKHHHHLLENIISNQ